jgi:hypothetical protein
MKNNLVKNAIFFDAGFNLLLGLAIIFFHNLIESWLSPSQVMTRGLWIFIGIVLLLYGVWQSIIILQKRIDKSVELISGIIAWVFFIILAYVLLFVGLDLYKTPYIVLWVTNVYIFIGGIFFFWAYKQTD